MHHHRLIAALLAGALLLVVVPQSRATEATTPAGLVYAGDVTGVREDAVVAVDNRRGHVIAVRDEKSNTSTAPPTLVVTRLSG
ncbi:MAG TPA: hypothetical protein VGB03_02780, partial [Acidimicrobiales bacterium]